MGYLNSMQTTESLDNAKRCIAICSAESYDLLALANYFKSRNYATRLSRDVLHIHKLDEEGDVFFFSHGSFVCWGFDKTVESRLLKDVGDFSSAVLKSIEVDNYFYAPGDETLIETQENSRIDLITLESDDPNIKLALSYGLSQSIKLESFEEQIKGVIKKNQSLPSELARRGKISLSRRALLKRMGEIFIARSSINLKVEYLDMPEYFWRNPNLEQYYVQVSKFLDLESRVAALNQQLDVLQELLDILNNQIMHIHSSILEGVIIILIFVEILISLFQIHLV